jgi:type I restriction enzyme S subunit
MNEITDANIVEIIEKAIDRSKWEKFKFSDLFENVVEKVVPKNSGLEHYIGLEHLDSGSLHIKRFGDTSSLIGDKLKIYKGDIIFAKRNAYLKRASIAPFDAVASAHSLVLRPKEKNVLPEFIPFFLMSEKFWERAIEISVGSLSPTINWKSLAKQEFLLPPKDQQAKLAELLWAMDEVIEREKEVFKQVDNLFKVKTKLISETKNKKNIRKLKDICLIKDNLRKPINSSERDLIKGDVPYFGANGLVDYLNDYIFNEDLVLIAEDGGNFNEFFNREIAYRVSGKSWVNNHAHVLTVKNNSFPIDWLFYSLVHKNILKHITGTTRLKLNKSDLENITIWLPQIDEMNILIEEMQKIDFNRSQINIKLESSQSLQKSLINQVF